MVDKKKPYNLQKDQKVLPSKAIQLGETVYSDVPTEPQELVAAFKTARFITLKWKEPEQSSTPVLAYSVYYKLKGSDR